MPMRPRRRTCRPAARCRTRRPTPAGRSDRARDSPPWTPLLPAGGLEQRVRGVAQPLDLVEFLVLVLDVDRHVRVDLLQRLQEPRPEVDVVAAPDGDEVP